MIANKAADRSTDILGRARTQPPARNAGASSPSSPAARSSADLPGVPHDAAIPALQAADEVLDSMVATVRDVRQHAAPLLRRASEQASALARRGVDGVRDNAARLRDTTRRSSQRTASYIKEEPAKAILIAAATAAAVIGLASLIGRLRDRD